MNYAKDKGEEMTAIAKRIAGTPAANVQDMATLIAKEAPTLADLNSDQAGITMPASAVDMIKAAGLDVKKPFAGRTANSIERRINYHIGKLYQAGKIGAAYSCHDFRHLFAVNEYKKDKDIVRVSKLLNHANVSITQNYLRGLGVSL